MTENAIPIVFHPATAELEQLRAAYADLRISGLEDKEGAAAVQKARRDCKAHRTKIEARRKELKQDALEYGRRVDDTAKALTAILEPTERRLEEEERRIMQERERIQIAERDRQLVERKRRLAIAGTFGEAFDPTEVEAMTPEAFIDWCGVRGAAKEKRDAEARAAAQELARLKREEDERRAEEARKAKVKADNEAAELVRYRRAAETVDGPPAPKQQTLADVLGVAPTAKEVTITETFDRATGEITTRTPEGQVLHRAPAAVPPLPVTSPDRRLPQTCPTCNQVLPEGQELSW